MACTSRISPSEQPNVDELVLKTNLIGTEEMVRERIRKYRDAGASALVVSPEGQTLEERVTTLGRLMELVKEVDLGEEETEDVCRNSPIELA